MNSRSTLVAAGFCLACTILFGSALMQFAVGSTKNPVHEGQFAAIAREAPAGTESSGAGEETSEKIADRGQIAARKLELLLRRADTVIDERSGIGSSDDAAASSAPLPEEAISLFAEMVRLIDETSGYSFLVMLGDPNLENATRRAEVLRSSLLLALRHPSRLQIEERPTSRAQVTVRAIKTSSMP